MSSRSPYEKISLTTREKAVLLANSFDTVGLLASHLGVSVQRVRQIFNDEGITKFRRQPKPNLQCPVCKKLFYPKFKGHIYCSMKCSRIAHAAVMVCRKCKVCGKIFYTTKSDIRPGTTAEFCSRKCRGRWLGVNYGLRAKPQNIRRNN